MIVKQGSLCPEAMFLSDAAYFAFELKGVSVDGAWVFSVNQVKVYKRWTNIPSLAHTQSGS